MAHTHTGSRALLTTGGFYYIKENNAHESLMDFLFIRTQKGNAAVINKQ